MNNFRYHLQSAPNVKLYVGEIVYGDGDLTFEVTNSDHKLDSQFRSKSILFHKENCLNEVVKRFPTDWKYGAYIDGDFTFTRHDWALEAVHKLQHHPFVQLFSQYMDLGPSTYGGHVPISTGSAKSFAATYIDNGHSLPQSAVAGGWAEPLKPTAQYGNVLSTDVKPSKPQTQQWIPVGATGGAWAFTREAFETVGGLLDPCILGHSDWFMAFGLVSQPTRGDISASMYHEHYKSMLLAWQTKAAAFKANIGVVDGFAVHHYHGKKADRGYGNRDLILVNNQFDPIMDLTRNYYGIYELTGNKPALRDAILKYFYSRNEDN